MARGLGWLLVMALALALCPGAVADALTAEWALFWRAMIWLLSFFWGGMLAALLDAQREQQRQREERSLGLWCSWLAQEGVRPEMSESPASYNKEV